jgi:hypothetical protein
MTNDPDSQNGRTTETNSPKPGAAPSSTGGAPKTPAKIVPMRDPVRREYGDRTDDDSKQRSPGDDDAMSKDPSEKRHDDSGEGHKGQRAEAKPAPTDKREHTERSDAAQRNQPKPKPQHGDGKPTPPAAPATKHNDAKSDRPQHGGGSGR